MILNSINLHNFMSYGDTTLDLTSFSIACLSGMNGAGKSAILDAITWALWECARSSSDELIRLGESEMWVDLTFVLDDQLYRVRRARQKNSPRAGVRSVSKGQLDFQIWQREQGSWSSLSAANMRESQERINQILRMDYDTFINSVYLRQGRADEFTTRPPSERKQVLAEILGLHQFDRLQELAKEEARARRAQIDVLQHNLNGSFSLNEHIEAGSEQLRAMSETLRQACENLESNRNRLQIISSDMNELQSLQSRLQPTQARLGELSDDLRTLQVSVDKARKLRDELTETLKSASELEEASRAFKHAKQKVEQLDHLSLKRQELDNKQSDIKSALATMRGRMEVEFEHLKEQREKLNHERDRLAKETKGKQKIEAEYAKYKSLLQTEADMAKRQEAHNQLTLRAEQLHSLVIEAKLHLEAELDHKKAAVDELRILIASRSTIGDEEKILEQEAAVLDTLEVEFENVEESGIKIKQQIDNIGIQIQELHRRLTENDDKAKELQQASQLTMCPLCAAPIVDRAAVMSRYEVIEKEIRSQMNELETQSAILEDKRAEMRHKYVELRRKLDGRKSLDKRIGEFNAKKAALERADSSFNKLTAEVAEIERRLFQQDYSQVERESLIAMKAELFKLDFDPVIYTSLQAQIRAQRHVEFRHQQFKKDEEALSALELQLPALDQRIADLSRQLDYNDFGNELRAQLQTLADDGAEIQYDRIEHQALRQELVRLMPLADKFKELDRARDQLPAAEDELQTLESTLKQKQELFDSLEKSVRDWNERLDKMPSIAIERTRLEEKVVNVENEKQELGRQIAVLESKLEHMALEQANYAARKTQLDTLLAETNDYEFLAETFGKKGIQAIIIENVVPEIETEANKILQKLTDNQMHVALVTQTKTRQGVLQETLDILIADDMGTRNYELYSGGETFKINFAIRVALSRLLARRAGAKLQSLIVDEGFGSQDEISRGRLIKAIHSIQPDFARILVVTHIAEIKEMFPVQIQVQKQNGISTAHLVHSF